MGVCILIITTMPDLAQHLVSIRSLIYYKHDSQNNQV